MILYKAICILNSVVWLVNGLYCKVLDRTPRHRYIVARILGPEHVGLLTKVIGFSEIGMSVWIITGIASHLNAITQIVIIGLINAIEFIYASNLLLWGKLNASFALSFMLLIYVNEFIIQTL